MISALSSKFYHASLNVRGRTADALGRIGSKTAIPSLLKLIEDSSYYVRERSADALSSIAKKQAYIVAPCLVTLLPSRSSTAINRTILVIQSNCKFYNYEVFQTHLVAQNADRSNSQNRAPNAITIQTLERLTIMTDKSPIFNQQHATIGVNYAAEGSTIEFTQHTSSSEQTFEILLTEYEQFIEQLQQKYPALTDPTTVPQIIEVEAKLLEAQDHQRWQNFLNLKRLWNGGKKAAIKVGEHFAENNVWAKGAIAFLEGVSEDGK